MACDTSHDVSLVYPDSLKNHNQALRLRKHSIQKENYFLSNTAQPSTPMQCLFEKYRSKIVKLFT